MTPIKADIKKAEINKADNNSPIIKKAGAHRVTPAFSYYILISQL
jgi:hypothetical protein